MDRVRKPSGLAELDWYKFFAMMAGDLTELWGLAVRLRFSGAVFVRAYHTRDIESLLDQPIIALPPDIAIEILSKHETRRMRLEKLEDYCRIGVKECWVVSPQAYTVEILRLSPAGTHTIGIYGAGRHLRSEILEAFELLIDEIFA